MFFSKKKENNQPRKLQVKLHGLVDDQIHILKLTPEIKHYGDLTPLIIEIIGEGYEIRGGIDRHIIRIPYEFQYSVNRRVVAEDKDISKKISEIEVFVHNRGDDTKNVD